MSSRVGLRDLRVCGPLINVADWKRPRWPPGRLWSVGTADGPGAAVDMLAWSGTAKGDAQFTVAGGDGCWMVAGMQSACCGR